MTTCILVATLIKCTIAGTVPTPAQAAAILAPHQTVVVAVPTWFAAGVGVYPAPLVVGSSGPYRGLELTMPERRLDGSLRSDPAYESVTYLPWSYGGYSSLGAYRPRVGSVQHRGGSVQGERARGRR